MPGRTSARRSSAAGRGCRSRAASQREATGKRSPGVGCFASIHGRWPRLMAMVAACACAVLTAPASAGAAAGTPDPTFGADGIASIDRFTTLKLGWRQGGGILVAGYSVATGDDPQHGTSYQWDTLSHQRLDASGDPVAGYGDGGRATTALGFGVRVHAEAVAGDSAGRTWVAGAARGNGGNGNPIAVARYKPDGTLDGSFGSG